MGFNFYSNKTTKSVPNNAVRYAAIGLSVFLICTLAIGLLSFTTYRISIAPNTRVTSFCQIQERAKAVIEPFHDSYSDHCIDGCDIIYYVPIVCAPLHAIEAFYDSNEVMFNDTTTFYMVKSGIYHSLDDIPTCDMNTNYSAEQLFCPHAQCDCNQSMTYYKMDILDKQAGETWIDWDVDGKTIDIPFVSEYTNTEYHQMGFAIVGIIMCVTVLLITIVLIMIKHFDSNDSNGSSTHIKFAERAWIPILTTFLGVFIIATMTVFMILNNNQCKVVNLITGEYCTNFNLQIAAIVVYIVVVGFGIIVSYWSWNNLLSK